MLSRFFIDRPIFAWVIAIIVMIAGALSVVSLPVRQYPAIAPPSVGINVNYPGASAQTVQDTVIQVIEQQLNGIDNLTYITSESEFRRLRGHHADVRAGHGAGYRAGAGAEQAADGDAAAAAGSPAVRHPREQTGAQLPHGDGFHLRRRQHEQRGPDRLRRDQHPRSVQPHRGRRRRHDVRLAVRDAHLARSRQAQQLRPRPPATWSRRSARRTCRCRWGRSAACRRRRARRSAPASSDRRASPRPSSSATSCCA